MKTHISPTVLKLIPWISTSLIVITAGIYQNPNFLNFQKDYDLIVASAFRSPSTQFGELQSQGDAIDQYRKDPQRTGLSHERPSLPVKIEKQIKPLNIGIHTASKSSPVFDETGYYVGSDSGWFWKFNFEGEKIWGLYLPGSDNGIHGTAAVDDKKVYIGAYNGFMYALNKRTGELVWATPVGNYIGASPLIANNDLYIAVETYHPDGFLVKLDRDSGETLWASEWFRGHSHSSPTWDDEHKALIVGANSGRVFSIDAQDGKTNWTTQVGGPVKGTALVWNNKAYLSSWDKNYYALDLSNGKTLWKTFVAGRNQTTLSPVPGLNIGIANNKAGDLMALDLETGEFVWRLRHGDSNHQFSVLVTENPKKKGQYIAWSRCQDYNLCILDANNGKLLQKLKLPGKFTSVPSAHDQKIYITLDREDGLVILGN